MMNLGLAFVATASLLSIARAADSFLYNEDAECTLPFATISVDSLYCAGERKNQNQGYQGQQQESSDDACFFDDMMTLDGSFELHQKVNRYFAATFQLCYYGSTNLFYKPARCKTIKKNIDMRDYVVMEQQYEEEDEVKEGYNYESYYQDEESQKWAEAQEQYDNQQAVYTQTYLYPGLYTWNIGILVPSKSFYFGNGSELHVALTLTPKDSYTMPYYRAATYYDAPIRDSKYRTQCYLSFQAIPNYDVQRSYNFYAAGLGFLLLGAATYVSSRRQVCTCIREKDKEAHDAYHQHTPDKKIELPKTGRNIPDAGDNSLYSL